MLAVPDPRIEPAVGDVDQQVDEDENHGDDNHDALHGPEVRVLRNVEHDVVADARYAVDELQDDVAADDVSEKNADDRQYRNEGVFQGVPDNDDALSQTLRLGGTDVVLAQDLQHLRAQKAHDDGAGTKPG